jgi:hypothetical protein
MNNFSNKISKKIYSMPLNNYDTTDILDVESTYLKTQNYLRYMKTRKGSNNAKIVKNQISYRISDSAPVKKQI